MRRERGRRWALGVLAGLCLVGLSAAASDPQETPLVRRTEKGLHFDLPADWPVEERGGLVVPVPVEEYVAMKFRAVDQRLQAMEQRLGSLDVRLRVLEETVKRGSGPAQGLRSNEPRSAAPPAEP